MTEAAALPPAAERALSAATSAPAATLALSAFIKAWQDGKGADQAIRDALQAAVGAARVQVSAEHRA